eukprot:685047-Pelagomonas_calceolata.AAC.1
MSDGENPNKKARVPKGNGAYKLKLGAVVQPTSSRLHGSKIPLLMDSLALSTGWLIKGQGEGGQHMAGCSLCD